MRLVKIRLKTLRSHSVKRICKQIVPPSVVKVPPPLISPSVKKPKKK